MRPTHMTALDAPSTPPMLTLQTSSGSQARISPYGAQVVSWTHRGKERLFLSPNAVFQTGEAIRGGIPVIFPQFGANGPGLRHGFGRLSEWAPVSGTSAPDQVTLVLNESDASLHWWPHRFRAELEVQLRDGCLSTSLTVTNRDQAAFDFTAALHTYLRVSGVENTELLGLQGQPYIDAADARRPGVQHEATLRFSGEVDRVYMNSGGRELVLKDAAGAMTVNSEGFTDTVIWNPGAELAASLADLGPGNHSRFVCVEAASVEVPVRLVPGATWQGRQILTCIGD